ncbi:hypothetical protein VCB98_07005 [Gammaproteobacteria bacterium AB-CW1]|uniref:Uncharacterized protein n=1 Tax=Natronospira elongata TaxID=3110268 RepID=A0AAP6JEK5_9GAMM|nr:hypothetical protein [Gammaproteobacteria bacterium AB-CW1]
MKKIIEALSILIAIVFLAGAAWGVLKVAQWVGGLDPAYAGPTIAAVIGFVGLLYGQWHSKTREIEQSHRPQKIQVYNAFFSILEKFLKNPDALAAIEGKPLPDELRDQFWALNQGLIIWASPPVIKAWLKFRKASVSGEHVLLAMDGMLRAIRKDLGNSNIGLQAGDAVKVFLSDPNELDRLLRR